MDIPSKSITKNHVLRACTPSDKLSVGRYEELVELAGKEDPFRAFQQTVETCALVICLWISKEQIWDTYTKKEKRSDSRVPLWICKW